MRSGNGRHRRPRQAPAFVVAAGVTGAGIATPALRRHRRQAADAATWDQVAECESGGMWSADEGNGFYGGLQLTLDMWKEYGGTEYAPRPDLASRSQQIAIAESILGDRGPDAWPSCALGAGLADGGDAPDVDPGSTAPPSRQGAERGDAGRSDGRDGSRPGEERGGQDASGEPGQPHVSKAPDGPDDDASSPSPSSSGSSGSTGASDPSPSPSSGEGASEDPAGSPSENPSESPSDPADGSTPSGEHRGEPGAGEHETGHASRGGTDRAENPSDGGYTVRPGDNLSAIAEKQELDADWRRLYESNAKRIGTDPDLILPGQRLDLTIKGQ